LSYAPRSVGICSVGTHDVIGTRHKPI